MQVSNYEQPKLLSTKSSLLYVLAFFCTVSVVSGWALGVCEFIGAAVGISAAAVFWIALLIAYAVWAINGHQKDKKLKAMFNK